MDTNMDKYLGTFLDDRYEILEVIGTGGMAVVYKAMCHRLNRCVAVKILRDELAQDEEFRQRVPDRGAGRCHALAPEHCVCVRRQSQRGC